MISVSLTAQAVRRGLFAAAVSSVAFTSISFAADETAQDDQSKNEPNKIERIEVTGSKLPPMGTISSTPLTVIGKDQIIAMGVVNVGDLLNKMPQSTVGISPESSTGTIFASGLNQTDLRGLGSNRTLVLLNGHRYVGGSVGDTAVDLNNIPSTMIDRVEIITGGASAVYGSDAVAGVVNIITRKETDGLEFDASYTKPEQSGGEQEQYSFAYGTDFAQQKGHVMFSAVLAQEKGVMATDRDYAKNPIYNMLNPAFTTTNSEPRRVIYDNGRRKLNWLNESGVFSTDAGKSYTWGPSGDFHEMNMGDGILAGPGTNGNYCEGDCEGYDPVSYQQLRIPLKRQVYNLNADYQLNENVRLFTEMTYSHYTAKGISSPVFHTNIQVTSDNPFLSDAARQVIDADGGVAYIARMDNDFGDRTYNQTRDTKRVLVGLDGVIGTWNYSIFYQEGRLDADTVWEGQVFNDNYYQAIDAVRDGSGNIVCRDQSNGCVPLNIFGQGVASQEAIDWISTTASRTSDATQKNAGFTVSNELFELPAGPVSVALSGEWRREEGRANPDANMQEGRIFGNTSLGYSGAYEVNEWAAEFSVPLVEDVMLVKQLGLDLAYRYMNYTSVGSNNAWKLGLNWTVVDDLKFRATKSKDVRAPTVEELYQAKGQTYEGITDVCDNDHINAGDASPYRAGNCHAVGLPDDWRASDDWYKGTRPGFNAGNANLKEETSNAYTLGFVYTPSFLENFSLTADWWSFDIDNAITYIDVNTAVKYCYDSENLDNIYCPLFTRDKTTGDIVDFLQAPMNVATYKTKGVDIETNYSYDASEYGLFSFNLIATYLDDWRYNPTGFASDLDVDVGEYTNPRWKGQFQFGWRYGDLSVSTTALYRGKGVGNVKSTPKDNNYNNIPSQTRWNLSATYAITDALEVRGGILNVFDQEPPRNPYTYDNGNGYYDTYGRSFFAGINYTFR